MNNLTKKINKLKWLRAIGIDYYFADLGKKPKKLISIKNETLTISPILSNIVDNKNIQQAPVNMNLKRNNPNIVDSKDSNIKISSQVENYINKKIAIEPNYHPSVIVARTLADTATNLEELRKSLMNFDGCNLKKLANNTVFADGNPQSSLMFIGEAPGNNEDAQGIPFCGESGKLLDDILASINISRKHNAYITNTVFWRPPANRQPTEEEINICKPFIEKHISLINPKLIILVGNVAATSLLGRNAGITKIRQEYYWYNNQYLVKPIQTTAIFHPAYLLRQPLQKKTTWYDLLKIQEYINTNVWG